MLTARAQALSKPKPKPKPEPKPKLKPKPCPQPCSKTLGSLREDPCCGCLGGTEKDLGTCDSDPYRFLPHPNLPLQSTSDSAVTYMCHACGIHLSPSCPCKDILCHTEPFLIGIQKLYTELSFTSCKWQHKVYPEEPTSSGEQEKSISGFDSHGRSAFESSFLQDFVKSFG